MWPDVTFVVTEALASSVAYAQGTTTPAATPPEPFWRQVAFYVGVAGIIGSLINFLYTRHITTRNRRADRLRDEFTSTIRTPIESELAKIEECITAIRAAVIQPIEGRQPGLIAEITDLQISRLQPACQAMETILRRADGHDKFNGSSWADLGSGLAEEAQPGLGAMCNPASNADQVRRGSKSAARALQKLCDDLRNRLSNEADRITLGKPLDPNA